MITAVVLKDLFATVGEQKPRAGSERGPQPVAGMPGPLACCSSVPA